MKLNDLLGKNSDKNPDQNQKAQKNKAQEVQNNAKNAIADNMKGRFLTPAELKSFVYGGKTAEEIIEYHHKNWHLLQGLQSDEQEQPQTNQSDNEIPEQESENEIAEHKTEKNDKAGKNDETEEIDAANEEYFRLEKELEDLKNHEADSEDDAESNQIVIRKSHDPDSDYNYNFSLLGEAIEDPVVRYALETCNRKFLREMRKRIDIKKNIFITQETISDIQDKIAYLGLQLDRIELFIQGRKKTSKKEKLSRQISRKSSEIKANIKKYEELLDKYVRKLQEQKNSLQEYKENDQQYDKLKSEMIENGGNNTPFEGSMVDKISKSYVYFKALESLDTKFLKQLKRGKLLFNDYKAFADSHNINVVEGGIWLKKYPEWVDSKNLR